MAEPPGYLIGPKLLQQIQQTVRHYANMYSGGEGSKPRQQTQQRVSGKLDAALPRASSFATAPSSATFSVWRKNSSGDMVDTGEDLTVYNRMERIDFAANTPAQAEWIDGEWRIYVGDCA